MLATDIEHDVTCYPVKPFKVQRRAYCDSISCCVRYGLKRSKASDKESVKQKYILKEVPRGAIHCPQCGHVLYWKAQSVYV